MMMLMTAALAAASPAVSATPAPDGPRHMATSGSHEQKDCCPCCKDMADKHGGHDQHRGHTGQ